MANNRELSQLASLIVVDDTTRNIGIATTGFSNVGIGTTFPEGKFRVYDDNQNSNTYSSQVYRTSTNFSSGVGYRAYYESYYTTAGVQTSYASGINAQVSASVAAGSTNNGYVRAALDTAWRNNNNAQSSTDNGTLNILYGRGIQYGHSNDNAVSPITNTATGLYLTPYCLTGSIGTLIGLDINSVSTAVGATATNVYGINCEIDTTDGTNSYNLYISGNANNYIAGSVGLGTTNPTAKLNVVDNSSTDALRITQTGSGNALLVEDSANPDATPFVITGIGNVGIGTTNPPEDLSIFASQPTIFFTETDSGAAADNKTWIQTVNNQEFRWQALDDTATGGGNIFKFTRNGNQIQTLEGIKSGVTWFVINNNDRRVGIGTTNPGTKLNVVDNSSSDALRITQEGSGNALVVEDETSPDSSPFVVTGVGSVGIGTTNPLELLHVLGSTGAARFENTSNTYSVTISPQSSGPRVNFGGSTGAAFMEFGAFVGTNNLDTKGRDLKIYSTSVPDAFILKQDTGNIGIGTTNPTSKLHVIGNVLVTGITTSTDFNSSSDINLKDNIERIQNPIDKLQQLDGVTFNWKETHRASVGVIAQQVEKVLPQLVSGDETKTVNYNGLIALLIECVKEQQIEINNLKEKLK